MKYYFLSTACSSKNKAIVNVNVIKKMLDPVTCELNWLSNLYKLKKCL